MAKLKNPLKRIHKKFNKHIDDIIKYREDNNLEKIKITQITYLIAKHKSFIKIKNDIVNIKSYNEEIKHE